MRRIQLVVLSACCFSLVCFPPNSFSAGPEADFGFDGAAALSSIRDKPENNWSTLTISRLRTTAKAFAENGAVLEAAYELNEFLGDGAEFAGAKKTSVLRISDADSPLIDKRETFVGRNLDRLNISFSAKDFDFVLGRQAYSHGSARFFNTSDIFSPITPQSVYTEYKAGVDAFRASRIFTEQFDAEIFFAAHEEGLDQGAYVCRARYAAPSGDLSLLAGASRSRPLLGLDLSGDMGGAEIYFEGVSRFRDGLQRPRATAGIHTRFEPGLSAFVEVHFNGAGKSDADDYAEVMKTNEWKDGEIFLLNRWYSVLSVDYELHPLVSLGAAWLINHGDGSSLLQPALAWDASETATLRAGGSLGFGPGPHSEPNPLNSSEKATLQRSEFGGSGDAIFFELSFHL